jgi:hypothetical protein
MASISDPVPNIGATEESTDQGSGMKAVSLRAMPTNRMVEEGGQLPIVEHYWVKSPMIKAHISPASTKTICFLKPRVPHC